MAFVGTLEPRKDVPTLVRAFDRRRRRHPDLILVLAGAPGVGRGRGRGGRPTPPPTDRIRLPGYVTEDENVALLRGAAAVAYPSLEEGFGLPALEALACGTPLVTTSGSAMEEVAGEAGPPGGARATPTRLAEALVATLAGGAEVERRRLGIELAARHTGRRRRPPTRPSTGRRARPPAGRAARSSTASRAPLATPRA